MTLVCHEDAIRDHGQEQSNVDTSATIVLIPACLDLDHLQGSIEPTTKAVATEQRLRKKTEVDQTPFVGAATEAEAAV